MVTNPDLQQAIGAIKRQQFAEASALLTALLSRQPNNVQARWMLVQSLESQSQADDAQDQLRQLLIHVKRDLAAIDHVAGHTRGQRYPLGHVIRAYQDYLSAHPESDTAAFNCAYNLARDAQFEAAIKMYEHALALGISEPEEVHLNIANIYMDHLHLHNEARQHLEKALLHKPDYASAYYNLGNLAEQEGNREEASLNFRKCLETDPANESALARLADTQQRLQRDDPLFERLISVAENSNNSDLLIAMGKAHEQLGDFDAAWRFFTKGNALDQRVLPAYKPERAEAYFNEIQRQCSREWLRQFEGKSVDPVFICGMFRSGSTLLEQMLAAHPAFVAGGESEFFPRLIARELPGYPRGIESLSTKELGTWRQQHEEQSRKLFGDVSRQTDKRPDNFLYLGLIKALLPKAKIVVTERDWRDIATSIYSVRLGPGQNYATNLANIRHYIGLQTGLIDHWQEVLGSDLVRVRYEDLVLQPQATMTGLLDWLGESWDERCLSFHELKNSVKTASVWQVREPLHDKSIGRWQNYQRQFTECFGDDLDG